jgi:uroporphyrinogen-III synthase
MREAPLENLKPVFRFAERMFAGEFDMMILLTGVGTRALARVIASRYGDGRFAEALRKITVVARGPKPVAALREMDVPVTVAVPEPNTWRELMEATRDRPENRIAVQEYGKTNPELLDALRARPAAVTPARVYQWDLPEDAAPLREAVSRIVSGKADVVLFTTSIQVPHLFRIAAESGQEDALSGALRKCVVASIGPTTSEMLEEYGIPPDIAPSHPKMGFLVKETAERAADLLARKRGPVS